MRALDLFAGAGGWDVAASRLGIDADGVEIMKEAVATRTAAGLKTVGHDVWNYDLNVGHEYDGLIASPPCQTFSVAGKGAGRKALEDVLSIVPHVDRLSMPDLREVGLELGDERTALVLTPLWYAIKMRPKWIAWEQVPTVLPVWEACAGVLEEYGYSVWSGNLHAEQYGVPQTRKRAFLLASRVKDVAPPEPTHSRYYPRNPAKLDEGVKKWVSMAEALGWGDARNWILRNNNTKNACERHVDEPAPTLYFGQRCNYCAWEYRPDAIQMTNDRPNVARRGLDQPAPTVAFGHERPRWCWDRPSTTIVGSFKPEIVAAPGYRTTVSRQNAPDSVRVTVQEAGILQSFPADYPWQGAKGKQYLQVGNAVPPLLAEAALSAVIS